MPAGPAATSDLRRPGADSVPEDRHRPRVRHGGRDRPQADPLDDAESRHQLDRVGDELAPPVVGLRPDQDEQVVVAGPGPAQLERRPGQLVEPAVDDLEGRPPRPVVEDPIRVEGRHDGRILDEQRERRCRRGPGIDPAIEGAEERRGDEVAGVIEAIQAHRARIGVGRWSSKRTGPAQARDDRVGRRHGQGAGVAEAAEDVAGDAAGAEDGGSEARMLEERASS